MNFLIDTNILIPAEPVYIGKALEDNVFKSVAAHFFRAAQENKVSLFIHPSLLLDIDRDQDESRRNQRAFLLKKYPVLPDPPDIQEKDMSVLGQPDRASNAWVDNHLIAAILGDAVDFLVTEDKGIHKKAKRLGIAKRVLTITDALSILRSLFPVVPVPPPALDSTKAYNIVSDDPILDSLRKDYSEFDEWFTKCKLQHRQTWVIPIPNKKHVKAFCMVHDEMDDFTSFGITGKILKICTMKVSDEYRGFRYGELLIKAVFEYAKKNKYDWLYVTVFEKNDQMIDFLVDFGFQSIPLEKKPGEKQFFKPFTLPHEKTDDLSPLQYHIRFGPESLVFKNTHAFIIPILPEFRCLLFPETESQIELFRGNHAFGNSIRKAYLCNAKIRKIKEGDILLFYASQSPKSVMVVGIAEEVAVFNNADHVVRYAGKRTVYSLSDIQKLCKKGEVLTILFRQVKVLDEPIAYSELKSEGVLKDRPQSIVEVPEGKKLWLENRLNLSR